MVVKLFGERTQYNIVGGLKSNVMNTNKRQTYLLRVIHRVFTFLVGCSFISSCEGFDSFSGRNMSMFLCTAAYGMRFFTVESVHDAGSVAEWSKALD